MAEVAIKVDGLKELHALLQQLPAKVEANVSRGALRAAANVIAKAARNNAPMRTGALRKSIRVTSKASRGRIVTRVVAGNKLAWYAHLIEFGTGSLYQGVGTRSKRRAYKIEPGRNKRALKIGDNVRANAEHPGIRPQAFMRAAWHQQRDAAIAEMKEYFRKRIAKEFAKR